MKQTTHRLGAAAALLVLVAGFGLLQAQTTTTASSGWTSSAVNGTVTALDPAANNVTVKSDAGTTQTFVVVESTWMQSAGKAITVAELKVGDHVRVEPVPGDAGDSAARTAARLEVVSAPMQGSADTYGTPQRTVSTDRPVLGEGPDAGGDRPSMPASPGSTTGRSVSTDRPVLGQSPTPSPSTPPPPPPAPSEPVPAPSATTSSSSTYVAQATPPPPPSAGSSADVDADADREEDLPETASPLPLVGAMGLLALMAGLALRATRKQRS